STAPAGYSLRASTMAEWREWARGLGECAINTVQGGGRPVSGTLSHSVRTLAVRELGLLSQKQLQLHEIRLGPDLLICGLSAEVAVEYCELHRILHPPEQVSTVCCVRYVFGDIYV